MASTGRREVAMQVQLREESMSALVDHARVSSAFTVDRVLDVVPLSGGLGGFRFAERVIEHPFLKDYDAIAGHEPWRWPERFDTSSWALISAWTGDQRIGGIVLAWSSKGIDLLANRTDVALIWDLRVDTAFRQRGVATSLLRAAEAWCAGKECWQLMVETQSINIAACTCYSRHGFVVGAMNRFAYAEFPAETQLIWYKGIEQR